MICDLLIALHILYIINCVQFIFCCTTCHASHCSSKDRYNYTFFNVCVICLYYWCISLLNCVSNSIYVFSTCDLAYKFFLIIFVIENTHVMDFYYKPIGTTSKPSFQRKPTLFYWTNLVEFHRKLPGTVQNANYVLYNTKQVGYIHIMVPEYVFCRIKKELTLICNNLLYNSM